MLAERAPGEAASGNGWLGAVKVLSAVAAVFVIGRFLTRPILRILANTGLREVFTGFALLLVLGIAAIMDSVGVSMALGAFLAGVLLAGSEYRHALESDIEPFKGLLMGLFFIAVGMSANVILRANGLDASRVTLLAMQITDNNIKALTTRKIAATLLAPPYAQELEAKGYNKLAEARTYAPLSFIGLVTTTENVKKNPQKVLGVVGGLYRTMNYLLNPANHNEVVQYVASYHKLDPALAEKAFTAQMPAYSKDGTKPRSAVEREIEIYRDTLKITKTFTPDDLEDLSLLRKVQRR